MENIRDIDSHHLVHLPYRPTTDIAKSGLFNILNNYWNFENIKFLDLFWHWKYHL